MKSLSVNPSWHFRNWETIHVADKQINNKNNIVFVILTRMTTFMKTKFNKSDDQSNIDKYRAAANITIYHIISKLIFLRILILKFMEKINYFL